MANAETANLECALVVRRTLSAPAEDVFEALTDADVLQRWMGPGNVECIAVESDPRVDGRFRIHMCSEEGDHIAVGEYREVVPNRRLVFTWSWETGTVKDTLVTVTLQPRGDATALELLHEKLPDQDTADKHTQGWTACLDNLAALY